MTNRVGAQFALGTAQLGLNYGVANADGCPSDDEAAAIFSLAAASGVNWLDTAQDYGDAESRIGELAGDLDFRIVTKIGRGIDHYDGTALIGSVRESATRLGRNPDAVLIHDPGLIAKWNKGVGAALTMVKDAGLTRLIGVSVYTPEQFAIAASALDIDVIQAPLNVLDRRLEKSGLLDKALNSGKMVFARSLYLQGLLTMTPGDLPEQMAFAKNDLVGFRNVCDQFGIAPHVAAFRFVRQRYSGVLPVVGCETAAQLEANLTLMREPVLADEFMVALSDLPQCAELIVNPAMWPQKP